MNKRDHPHLKDSYYILHIPQLAGAPKNPDFVPNIIREGWVFIHAERKNIDGELSYEALSVKKEALYKTKQELIEAFTKYVMEELE